MKSVCGVCVGAGVGGCVLSSSKKNEMTKLSGESMDLKCLLSKKKKPHILPHVKFS